MSLGTEVEVPDDTGTPNVAPFIQEGRRGYPGLFQDRESNICSREIIGKHSRDNINLHLGWGGITRGSLSWRISAGTSVFFAIYI